MKLKDIIQPKPQEEILLMVRESLIPHGFRFILLAIWTLLPFFFFFPLFEIGTGGITIFLIAVVSGLFFFWRAFRKWSRTILVITDQRMIDVEQRGLFDRIVTETTFDQMEEVRYRMRGACSALFRYGTIFITCHGAAADLRFDHARNPIRIQNLLNDLRQSKHA